MVVIIADAGPLIALAKIDHLHLLPKLFSRIAITHSVAEECLCNHTKDALLIRQALEEGWLQSVANPIFMHPLSRSLGLGEQSSIELALQSPNKTLLILDDSLARKQALRKKLEIIGTAAILFTAQRKRLIEDAEIVIAQLNQIGYRISLEVVIQLKNGLL